MRVYYAPVRRDNGTPAAFDPAVQGRFALSAPPVGWTDLGYVSGLKRKSVTKVMALESGAPMAVRAQTRTGMGAEVSFTFNAWGKLQMGLSAGSQQMNLLAASAAGGFQPIYVRKECVASYRDPEHRDPDCLARGIPTVTEPKSGRVLLALAILALTSPVWLTRLWGRFQRTGLAIAVIPYWVLGLVTTTLSIVSPLPYIRPNETDLALLVFDIVILFLSPVNKVKYAKFRVGMLAVMAVLLLVNVLHQPIWTLMLWPLIPMATVAFWRPRA